MKNAIYSISTFILKLLKKHFFLLSELICSFIIAILPCLYCLFTFYHVRYKLYGLIFLIPFLVVLFFTILAIFLKKHHILINITIICINIFIIFTVQIIIGFTLLDYYYWNNVNSIGEDPKYYKTILNIFPQEKITHFPKQIPNNAENIQLYSNTNYFFGSQELLLKFNINSEYIKDELKKHKLKDKIYLNHYAFETIGNKKINIDDFTLYIIDGNLNRWAKNYGIGVNKDFTQILYYYTNPD